MNKRNDADRGQSAKFTTAYEEISQGAEAFVKGMGRTDLAIKAKALRIENLPGDSMATFTLQVRGEGISKHFQVTMNRHNTFRVKDLDARPQPSLARNSTDGFVFSSPVQALGYIVESIESKFTGS